MRERISFKEGKKMKGGKEDGREGEKRKKEKKVTQEKRESLLRQPQT